MSRSAGGRAARISPQTTSVASLLATSPPAAPPMPSHTTSSGPRGPLLVQAASAAGLPWSRSPIRKQSWLDSRASPTSVRANTSETTPAMGLRRFEAEQLVAHAQVVAGAHIGDAAQANEGA